MSKHNKKYKEVKNIPFYLEKNGLTYFLVNTYCIRNNGIVGQYTSNIDFYRHSGTFEFSKTFRFSPKHNELYSAYAEIQYQKYLGS